MKLTNEQLRQIIKEELEAVFSENMRTLNPVSDPKGAIAYLQQQANTSAGGIGADGKMRGEAYISQEELNMALGAIQKFQKTGHVPSDQEMQKIISFGPSHEKDNTLEYKQFHGFMKTMATKMYN